LKGSFAVTEEIIEHSFGRYESFQADQARCEQSELFVSTRWVFCILTPS
jgi:hypothetical protein